MPKFKKKPIVVEAEQFFTNEPLPFSGNGDPVKFGCDCNNNSACSFCNKFYTVTLEGIMIVSEGDYVIKGIQGEFYPCKPDIFLASYEEVI